MNVKSDLVYFDHIIAAASRIEEYLCTIGRDMFERAPLLQDGALRQLSVIFASAQNISSAVKNRRPDLPWADMLSLEHRFVNEDFAVDTAALWLFIKNDLPKIKSEVTNAKNNIL